MKRAGFAAVALITAFVSGMLFEHFHANISHRSMSLISVERDEEKIARVEPQPCPSARSERILSSIGPDPKTDPPIPLTLGDELALEVSKTLVNPSQKDYNLEAQGPYWSQYGQDRKVDEWLHHLEDGFFIEAGGLNGEQLSNTLYLERSRRWNGLLVEANPHLFQSLLSKHRKCFTINAGLSMQQNQQERAILKFKLAGPLGGFVDTYAASHLDRTNNEIAQKQPWMAGVQGSGAEVNVSTYPLHTILSEIRKRRGPRSEDLKGMPSDFIMVVDFFSLDTEGSEFKILQAIDFDKIMFGLLVVEFNGDQNIRKQLLGLMTEKKYELVQEADIDLWFGNRAYFQLRKLTWPGTG